MKVLVWVRIKAISNPIISVDNILSTNEPTSKKDIEEVSVDFLNKIKKLLDNDKFSDIKLKIGDKELKAHKNILAVQSPVFLSMLSAQENIREIVLNDIDFEVMSVLINFMYTGEAADFDLDLA